MKNKVNNKVNKISFYIAFLLILSAAGAMTVNAAEPAFGEIIVGLWSWGESNGATPPSWVGEVQTIYLTPNGEYTIGMSGGGTYQIADNNIIFNPADGSASISANATVTDNDKFILIHDDGTAYYYERLLGMDPPTAEITDAEDDADDTEDTEETSGEQQTESSAQEETEPPAEQQTEPPTEPPQVSPEELNESVGGSLPGTGINNITLVLSVTGIFAGLFILILNAAFNSKKII